MKQPRFVLSFWPNDVHSGGRSLFCPLQLTEIIRSQRHISYQSGVRLRSVHIPDQQVSDLPVPTGETGELTGLNRMKASLILYSLVSLFTGAQSGDQIPSIITNYAELIEDTPIGAYAFQIEIYDPDVPPDPLTYTLSGLQARYFSVDENTGRVTVQRRLDREDKDNEQFKLGVTIYDGKYTVDKDIEIIILDANDNKPTFEPPTYNENVLENTLVNAVLFKVSATDIDSGTAAAIKYSIDDASPSDGLNHFSINENTGDVKLIKSLNYVTLSTFYRLLIRATDGGGPTYDGTKVFLNSTAFAFITVVDVADLDPVFQKTPYEATVNEHALVGYSVFQVTAVDQDPGINDVITFSIEDTNAPDLFVISTGDGVISVKSDIDREALLDVNSTVVLKVKATEAKLSILGYRANTTTDVRITIGDINDNKPQFYNCEVEPCVHASSFTANIFEHSTRNVPVDGIKIKAIDLDQRDNGKFELRLEGPDKDVFSVSPSIVYSESNVEILVKNSEDLDYEKKTSMVVQIIATDPTNIDCCSTATVTIEIMDTNDISPTFAQDTYKLEVAEHSPNGTIVATITATDPDTMDDGKITYRLLPENMLKYFSVDANTGTVFVNSDLDREIRDLYFVTLQARDSDNNPDTTLLEIQLTDINDNKPEFIRDPYTEKVKENSNLGINIQATDRDEPPNNVIVYGIAPGLYSSNFTIDPITGWLQNKGPLNREAIPYDDDGKINLTVTATDTGDQPQNQSVSVIITIEDINDNPPKFRETSYKFSVEEGKKAAFVGSVQAVDSDQTNEYNRISFSISSGQFFIQSDSDTPDGYIGNITVDLDIELDYESNTKSFSLVVTATDQGSMTDSVPVEVIVIDVNDERPYFESQGPFLVRENTTSPLVNVNFKALDLDSNHSLVYTLVSSECHCNGSWGKCEEDWFTVEPNGTVTRNLKFVVDYEKCDQVNVQAQVVDKFTQKGENNSKDNGVIVINIEDINDNAPVFEKTDNLHVLVLETASVGSVIASVTATDRDSGKNRQITFEIIKSVFMDEVTNNTNTADMFDIVNTQENDKYVGNIQNKQALEINVKGRYYVTIKADNTEEPKLSSVTILEILTVDKSYRVELRFGIPPTAVKLKEEDIKWLLLSATKATVVQIVKIRGVSSDTKTRNTNPEETIMEVYFVYANGTALNSVQASAILTNSEQRGELISLGLKYIGSSDAPEEKTDPVLFTLLGLVAGLIIILAVMTTTLVCTRRSYKTKLKAAKAMNSAAMMATGGDHKSGPIVPGTNKYTMDGANPVLNLNIDTATDLGFDEEDSNADRVSLNSLDFNIDMVMSDKDNGPMMMIQEEDEDWEADNSHVEPLGEALARRGRKRDSNSPSITFNNPAFSTTDL
ncbi:hypothetical protein UPYG_G00219060 [Umbra pygmaea]|uniref:Cadherin domain-containing protein n=1 Tax=Umbra pygmaea TaxID=75934 RepID=A0ABD0WRD7_UMBPY